MATIQSQVPPQARSSLTAYQQQVLSAKDRKAMVYAPPSLTLGSLGLDTSDFTSLVTKIKLNQELSKEEKKTWLAGLKLVSAPDLPEHPDDWTIEAEEQEDTEEYAYIHERGGLNQEHASLTYVEQIKILSNSTDELLWQTTYPFRVKGEAGLRRLRLSDLPIIFRNAERLTSVLSRLEKCRSYIFVLNMCLAEYIFKDYSYTGWYHRRGGLANVKTFLAFAKLITTKLKACVYNDKYLPLVENSVMSGYRLLPDPAFDIVESTKKSARGMGLSHSTTDGVQPWGWDSCINLLNRPAVMPTDPKILTFEEFVSDPRLWATSGSSSFGKLSFTDGEGKVQTTKARKLMLPYITTPQTLVEIAYRTSTTEAISLVKSELAKIRIAVASELGFYLIWSYLHYLYGDLYPSWPGVTLGETTSMEMKRLWDMYTNCSSSWGFPADFEQFDAQPRTHEIVAIGASLLGAAQTVTPVPQWLQSASLYGLLSSNLKTPRQPNGEVHSYRVTDYLPSGIAITSAVGNGFNCVASWSMIRLVESWTQTNHVDWLTYIALRGDDSSFQVTHMGYALLLSLSAVVLNYKHAPNKVALLQQATELLRVSISHEHGCRGYPCRLVPTLTQRKPWSNDPWEPEGVIRSQWDTCCALVRRRCDGYDLWSRLAEVWSHKRKLPQTVLTANTIDGGLGIGVLPNDFITVTPSITTPVTIPGKIKSAKWAVDCIIKDGVSYGITVPSTVAQEMADTAALATLSTVDLPEAAKAGQTKYKEFIANLTVVDRPVFGLGPELLYVLGVHQRMISDVKTPSEFMSLCSVNKPRWLGSHSSLQSTITFRRQLEKYKEVVLPLLPSSFIFDVKTLMRKFRCPASIAEDWLIGLAPSFSQAHLHPNLKEPVSMYSAHLVEQSLKFGEIYRLGFGIVCQSIYWTIGLAFAQSPLHTTLYSW